MDRNRKLFFISLPFVFLIFFCLKDFPFLLLGLFALGFTILWAAAIARPPLLWALVAAIFISFQAEVSSVKHEFIPRIPHEAMFLLELLLFMSFLLYLYRERERIQEIKKEVFSHRESALLFLFLLFGVWATAWGMMRAHKLERILREAGHLVGYISFFVMMLADKKDLPIYWFILLGGVLIADAEYLYTACKLRSYLYLWGSRIFTTQIQISLPLFSLGYTLFIWGKGRERLLGITMIFLCFPLVFLGQSRALWMSMGVAALASTILSFFAEGIERKKGWLFILGSLIFIGIIVFTGLHMIRERLGEEFYQSIAFRFGTLREIGAVGSFKVRLANVLTYFRLKFNLWSIFLGWGLGNPIQQTILLITPIYFVDTWYINILWKMGAPALAIFLLFIFHVLKKFLYWMKTGENTVWALGYATFMVVLLFNGFATALLSSRRWILIFSGIIGMGYAYYRENKFRR